MTDERPPVTEDDLHAYVDGFLDEDHRRAVEAFLTDHPQEAADVAAWQAQAANLKAAFSSYARSNEFDETMVRPVPSLTQNTPWRKVALLAASLVLFLSGAAAGIYADRFLGGTLSVETASALESLPAQSKSAFLIYTSEKRHPVEVGADQQEHLVTWLGKRLDYKLVAPDLRPKGYSLVGGRLVPVNGKAGAMLMYENAAGKRLTMLLGKNPENAETSFRFESSGTVETFYWIDGSIGYAVTAELSRAELQAIAEECYRQFES
ncbi:anti-sigma factor family protein [Pararhizobium sp. O133]|uniref:anti-sigma factor family protein n=1 Tax=Pararhizobium sp. O133 TaxID=3449278 RepID=UPI003F6839D0